MDKYYTEMYFKIKELMSAKDVDSEDETTNTPKNDASPKADKLAKLLDAYKSHTIDLLNSNVHSYRQRWKRSDSDH